MQQGGDIRIEGWGLTDEEAGTEHGAHQSEPGRREQQWGSGDASGGRGLHGVGAGMWVSAIVRYIPYPTVASTVPSLQKACHASFINP